MKKVNKASLIQRMVPMWMLTEHIPEPLLLAETIVPTTDIDILRRQTIVKETGVTGTDDTHSYTVPVGKRWRLLQVFAERDNAATMEISIYVYDETAGQQNEFRFTSLATATTHHFNPGTPIVIERTANGNSNSVEVEFKTGTSGALRSQLIIEEEDAY